MTMIILDIANWIQAIAAIALVVLTGLTLWVLMGYAVDTKRIAEASPAQRKMRSVHS